MTKNAPSIYSLLSSQPPSSSIKQQNLSIKTNLDELRKMRILLVDDIVDNLELLDRMLKKSGFRNTTSAICGEEALQILQNTSVDDGNIDIILLDVMMPGMDGYEMCRITKQNPKWINIPVIMITANASWQDDIARISIDSGATDIMFKPIRRAELIPRVISALSLKKERDLRIRREHELENELAERKIIEARLQYLVIHDDLTGLSNRRRLEKELDHEIIESKTNGKCSALLYVDIDQFKVINDIEGHIVGDRLLISVANTLREHVRQTDILARISSDEYAILINNIAKEEILEMAESLRKTMDGFNFNIDDRTYQIGVSIGISLILPDENITASEVLAQADQACFVAKSHGRNKVHLYNQEDSEMHILRSAAHWVPLIREALLENKFFLLFQPVMNIATGNIEKYEALIRMEGSDESLLPNLFIPIAERMGLIHEIDLWVVENTIDVLNKLPDELSYLSFNINLSSNAFQDQALLPLVRNKLLSTGVAANRITFEITETAAVANYEQTRDMVNQLRELGCSFALDDFGAGFSSFDYIKQFPVDYLKIDGSFITNLLNDSVDQTLVKSMIEIAHKLGKRTVAEFVECEATLNLLREYGVDYAQGYYIGKPTDNFSSNNIEGLINTYNSPENHNRK